MAHDSWLATFGLNFPWLPWLLWADYGRPIFECAPHHTHTNTHTHTHKHASVVCWPKPSLVVLR
jgi:4-amino-4-deoxy-L-arabinose transferase-like glycosyltransferase